MSHSSTVEILMSLQIPQVSCWNTDSDSVGLEWAWDSAFSGAHRWCSWSMNNTLSSRMDRARHVPIALSLGPHCNYNFVLKVYSPSPLFGRWSGGKKLGTQSRLYHEVAHREGGCNRQKSCIIRWVPCCSCELHREGQFSESNSWVLRVAR